MRNGCIYARGSAIARAVALALTLSLAMATGANAAICVDEQDALTTWVPTHVHAGGDFTVTIENHWTARDVSGVTITMGGDRRDVEPRGVARTSYRFTAPERLGTLRVVVGWQQVADDRRASKSPECAGEDVHAITLVRRSERIGDIDEPRVDGRWRLVQTPLNYSERTTNEVARVRPRCAVGACAFRWSGGTIPWRPAGDETYRGIVRFDQPRGSCEVVRRNLITGETTRRRVDNAFLTTMTGTLRITKWRAARGGLLEARRAAGYVRINLTATGEARGAGCTSGIQRSRLVATKLP